MTEQLDVYDKCPHCKASWNGGDMRHNIATLGVMQGRETKEIDSIASNYNYETGKLFTLAIVHQIDDLTLYECPKCKNVFDKEGNEYFDVKSAINDIRDERLESDIPEEVN